MLMMKKITRNHWNDFFVHQLQLFYLSFSMEAKTSSKIISFILAVKRITLDEFLFQFRLANPRQIQQYEFARIVQRINQSGEAFSYGVLFDELGRGHSTIRRDVLIAAFFRVFRVQHMQLQGESILIKPKISQSSTNLLTDKGKQLAELGFNHLCKHMATKQAKLDKIFDDCDTDHSGDIDRNEFNKLLYASGIQQFRDKEIRRYLVAHVFSTIKANRIERSQFFDLFDSRRARAITECNIGPSKPIKKTKIGTLKKISMHNSQVRPLQRSRNEGSLLNPEAKPRGNNPHVKTNGNEQSSGNLSSDVPIMEFTPMNEAPQQASKYYRLGTPTIEDQPYIQELDRLLAKNKPYQDPKNPIAGGQYMPAANILQQSKYVLFDKSPEQMNSNRKNNQIRTFIEADDIKQGSVGDCYFLSAIGSLAADYPELISEKFLFEANPVGYSAVKLFIDGQWRIIKTDDNFPTKNEQFLYAKPHNSETWVILLEKAFAKVFGSYQAIDGGFQSEAFFALTGAPDFEYDFESEKKLKNMKGEIEEADKNGFLMTAAGSQYLENLSQSEREKIGLVSGHAYSLISVHEIGNNEVLVKLRNPWGCFAWKGNWSFHSPKWTPQLRKTLNYEQEIQDGVFYMCWNDFCKYYGSITICKINPTNVHTSYRMMNNKKKSNYIRMTVSTEGTYDIFICQESKRKYASNKNFTSSNSRIIIMKEGKNGKLQFVAANNSIQKQICNVEVDLEPGNYVISAKVIWGSWTDHECFLTSYGVEKVTFEKINRTIAPKFKQDLIESFSAINEENAEAGSMQEVGFAGIVTQTYFSIEEGIGFVKTINKTKHACKIETTFDLVGMKIIKPKKSPYVQELKPGKEDTIGFFIPTEGYQYSYSYTIETK